MRGVHFARVGHRGRSGGFPELVARYAAEPWLAVVESYALDVIGELSPEEVSEAEVATQALFGVGWGWREVVRDHMSWTPAVDRSIRDLWRGYQAEVQRRDLPADPASFARRFADASRARLLS